MTASVRTLAIAATVLALASCTNDFDRFEPTGDGADAAGGDTAIDVVVPDGGAVDGGNLGAGLLAFYKFDETTGTTCADSSGNNRTATLTGGATFTSGLQNNALTLSGNGQYVTLPANIVAGLTSFSVSAWVNLVATPTWARLFDFGTGTSRYLYLTPSDDAQKLRFAITTVGNGVEERLGASALSTASWQYVAVTVTGGTGVLYVNGVVVDQQPIKATPNDVGPTPQNWLGHSQFAADPFMNGKIDNFRIYGRGLSAAEVEQLYQQKL